MHTCLGELSWLAIQIAQQGYPDSQCTAIRSTSSDVRLSARALLTSAQRNVARDGISSACNREKVVAIRKAIQVGYPGGLSG